MVDGYVRLPRDGEGKKLQSFENTLAGDDVHAEAIVIVDENGVINKVIDNKIRVSSMSYTYDIAEGNVPDHIPVLAFGHNSNVPVTFEIVGDISDVYNYLAVAQVVKVISDDPDDTVAGAGARTVTVTGLDGSYNEVSQTIDMNGNVAYVATTQQFLRVHTCFAATAGATGVNEGTITIDDNAEANTINMIEPLEGQSHSANYTVPAGYTLYITGGWMTESSSKGSEIHLFVKPIAGAWRSIRVWNIFDSTTARSVDFPAKVLSQTDVELRAKGIQAGANVTAGFEGWIEK